MYTMTHLPNGFVITVDSTEFPLVGSGQHLFIKHFGILIFSLLEVARGEIVFRLGDVGIVWAKFGFIDFKGTLVVSFHLLVFTLILTEQRQIVQLLCDVRVISAENFLANFQSTFAQRFGFLVFTCIEIESLDTICLEFHR